MNAQLNSNNFWDTDLSEIDLINLGKGKKITDLPAPLDDRVHAQGSVLLGKVSNLNDFNINISTLDRVKHALTRWI